MIIETSKKESCIRNVVHLKTHNTNAKNTFKIYCCEKNKNKKPLKNNLFGLVALSWVFISDFWQFDSISIVALKVKSSD